MVIVRVWLPALIALAGVVLIVVGDETLKAMGVLLLGVALLVVLANLFIRLALLSERDREREQQRR
jgi:xanthosine utilization system XapX-like protein